MKPQKKVIAGGADDAHGSGIAFSTLPDGYEGPCRMTYGRFSNLLQSVVFGSRVEAALAANFAIQVDGGGYAIAELTVAEAHDVTHESCVDWICIR